MQLLLIDSTHSHVYVNNVVPGTTTPNGISMRRALRSTRGQYTIRYSALPHTCTSKYYRAFSLADQTF